MVNPMLDDKLSVSMHTKQLEIFQDKHRFKVVACGRRFGKTTLCAIVIVLKALSKSDQVLWIVSPTFPQTMYMWRKIKRIIPKKFIRDIKEGEKFIEIINGSTIWAKSGDNPDGLVGEGLDFCAIDEAARCKEEVWEVLRPSLSDKGGECWFLSTPKGKNWFYHMYTKERTEPEIYKSFCFPTHDNPILPLEEIESMKSETPELVFQQEILARFIDGGGVVFRSLQKCLGAEPAGPVPSHSYVIGIDLGKHQDWTVLSVGDMTTNNIVMLDRFNRLDWVYQKDRIKDVVKQYNNATVILDTTGLGDTIYDDLTTDGIGITPYKFTNASKNLLISNLMRTMDNGLVRLPDDQDLIGEFESYEFDTTDSGMIRYGAPRGMHDDIVTSVALCVWGLANACVNVIGRTDDPEALKGTPTFYDEEDIWGSYHDEDDEEYTRKPFGTNRIVMG